MAKRLRLKFPPLPTVCVVVGCGGDLLDGVGFCARHWPVWGDSSERHQLAASPTVGQEHIDLATRLTSAFAERIGALDAQAAEPSGAAPGKDGSR